jgi:hypothetical protein
MSSENHLRKFVAEQTKGLSSPARQLALKAIDLAKSQRTQRVPDDKATRQEKLTIAALSMLEDDQ